MHLISYFLNLVRGGYLLRNFLHRLIITANRKSNRLRRIAEPVSASLQRVRLPPLPPRKNTARLLNWIQWIFAYLLVAQVDYSCKPRKQPPAADCRTTALKYKLSIQWQRWIFAYLLVAQVDYSCKPRKQPPAADCRTCFRFATTGSFTTSAHQKSTPIYEVLFWWAEVDSNHRRQSRQIYSLLPLAARESARILYSLIGGAGDRNRTNNLLITNQLLCQLSYTSKLPFRVVPRGGIEPPTRGFSVPCSTD